ncbi:beta-propeller domain-containing protein [Myxococcota bacterium]|nr:beta-propeller domain-containing protein [Myxococcota bacterium]
MNARNRLRALFLVAGAAVWPTGCDDTTKTPPTIQERLALEPFGDCAELEQYIEDSAVQIMRNQLVSEYWSWMMLVDREAGADGGTPPTPAAGPSAYTTTNVQVAGVDEADFVKTNGTHIFVLSGEHLYITKSWPAADLQRIAAVPIEGYSRDMYLDEDDARVVVLSSVNLPEADHEASIDCLVSRCGEAWAPGTKVTVIDVSVPAMPVTIAELYLPGWHQTSRRIGNSLRIVLGDSFRWPEDVRWYPDYSEEIWRDPERLQAAREALADRNEPLIRARTLADWLPPAERRLVDGTIVDIGYSCEDFHRTNVSTWLGFTNVATIDLDHLGQAPESTAIIAYTDQVYASTDTLFLALRHWWWWPEPGTEDWTYFFAFDLRDPTRADYLGGGGAPGHVLNQFSMDEHEGFLRIATTINRWTVDTLNPENRWGRIETSNRVSVLGWTDDGLSVVGATPDLAPGQTIQSARFLGDRGFVVTYRQIDPLYTLDLSQPTSPRVVGELHVPGFSSYIHPLDADHLLTIGVYMPEPDDQGQVAWDQRRMKLSIYDVSDFANPIEAFTALIGTAYGWSTAGWDHHAFNYFPERHLLAIPFSDYRPGEYGDEYWRDFVSELRVFEISTTAGITAKGALTLSDVYRTYRYDDWSWSWSPWIERSVMADDWVYAISDAGIRAAHVDALSSPVATVLFDAPILP